MKKCPICGGDLKGDENVCPYCGASLVSDDGFAVKSPDRFDEAISKIVSDEEKEVQSFHEELTNSTPKAGNPHSMMEKLKEKLLHFLS